MKISKYLTLIYQQAGAAPGFSAKTWCLVCFLENLISIFNWEQDEVVLLIQLRNDLFKLRRHQCFILENALMEITMKKTLKLWFWRLPHNIPIFSLSLFLLVRLIWSYIPNISLLACLLLEIAMKKTLQLGLEDDLTIFKHFFSQ